MHTHFTFCLLSFVNLAQRLYWRWQVLIESSFTHSAHYYISIYIYILNWLQIMHHLKCKMVYLSCSGLSLDYLKWPQCFTMGSQAEIAEQRLTVLKCVLIQPDVRNDKDVILQWLFGCPGFKPLWILTSSMVGVIFDKSSTALWLGQILKLLEACHYKVFSLVYNSRQKLSLFHSLTFRRKLSLGWTQADFCQWKEVGKV